MGLRVGAPIPPLNPPPTPPPSDPPSQTTSDTPSLTTPPTAPPTSGFTCSLQRAAPPRAPRIGVGGSRAARPGLPRSSHNPPTRRPPPLYPYYPITLYRTTLPPSTPPPPVQPRPPAGPSPPHSSTRLPTYPAAAYGQGGRPCAGAGGVGDGRGGPTQAGCRPPVPGGLPPRRGRSLGSAPVGVYVRPWK